MELNDFLHNLHFDIDKVSPPGWEVDWEDAPLPYKLYRNLPHFPLSADVPLSLRKFDHHPDLRTIGHFFWYVYGLNQVSQLVMESDSPDLECMQSLRRFVPSGGALYPNELYVYLRIEGLPYGVYHYDVAHHRFVLLREGDFDSYIEKAVGGRIDVSDCFATVFVSTMFWKNFYKYNNFSYRLQGLDTGVLIGQLLEASERFGYESGVCVQFLDRAVNHLLGFSDREESVYGVIPLSIEGDCWRSEKSGNVHVEDLVRELPVLLTEQFMKSKKVLQTPMLVEMNEASKIDSTDAFRPFPTENQERDDRAVFPLPKVNRLSYDFGECCRKRYSPGFDFVLEKVTATRLASLFQEATSSFSDKNVWSRLSLYACLYRVEGIEDGAYEYDQREHRLRKVASGDFRPQLQSAMSLDNVNLFQLPICIHVVGDRDHYSSTLGYRGYRIQQIEAGMIVQRLLLVASALGLGGHPLLGFEAQACDDLYQLSPVGKTCLIQIPIGPYRERGWLKGNLNG